LTVNRDISWRNRLKVSFARCVGRWHYHTDSSSGHVSSGRLF
jgi:hypothetical protein